MHCCITLISKYKDLYGEKTYRFRNLEKWKDFNKKQLTLHKMCVTSLLGGRWADLWPSSETQGQSVGSGEKAGRKFSSTGERAPGYRLSPNYFQKFKQMPAPDWPKKMLCIIVHNRRTVSPEFFSWVRTRPLSGRIKVGRWNERVRAKRCDAVGWDSA